MLDEKISEISEFIENRDIYKAEKILNDIETKDERVDILKGRITVAKSKLNEAIDIFTSVIAGNPDNKDAYLYRGKIYMSKGNIEKGYQDLKKAYELDSQDFLIKNSYARAAISNEKYEEAGKLYREIYRYDRSNEVVGYMNSCNKYIVDMYEKKLDQLTIDDKVQLALAKLNLNESEAAKEILEEINTDANNVEGLRLYSSILRDEGKEFEAEQYIDKALKLDSNNAKLYIAKGMLREADDDIETALNMYNKAYEIDDNNLSIPIHLAITYLKLGDIDKASEYIEEPIEKNYDIEESLKVKARILIKKEKYEEAIKVINVALEKAPWYVDIYIVKIYIYKKMKNYREAFAVAEEALESGNYDERIGIEKAIILRESGELQGATDWIEWALGSDNNHDLSNYVKCTIEADKELFDSAIDTYNKISKDTKGLVKYCALMYVYMKQGNDKSIINLINEVITSNSTINDKADVFIDKVNKQSSILKNDNIHEKVEAYLMDMKKRGIMQ